MSAAKAQADALWDQVEEQIRATSQETGCVALDASVRAALRSVDRALFVPVPMRSRAYENRALPIGCGQTISQPFIVALMTQLLAIGPQDRVLEIGTGSGYQAAVLSRLAREVVSVEVIDELAKAARERLSRLGIQNVRVILGDGHVGCAALAPYDGVLITAAAERVPGALIEQLRVGGRLVAPLGSADTGQWLCTGQRLADGALPLSRLLQVAFVPFVAGDAGPNS